MAASSRRRLSFLWPLSLLGTRLLPANQEARSDRGDFSVSLLPSTGGQDGLRHRGRAPLEVRGGRRAGWVTVSPPSGPRPASLPEAGPGHRGRGGRSRPWEGAGRGQRGHLKGGVRCLPRALRVCWGGAPRGPGTPEAPASQPRDHLPQEHWPWATASSRTSQPSGALLLGLHPPLWLPKCPRGRPGPRHAGAPHQTLEGSPTLSPAGETLPGAVLEGGSPGHVPRLTQEGARTFSAGTASSLFQAVWPSVMGFCEGQEEGGPRLTAESCAACNTSRPAQAQGRDRTSPHWAWAVAIWEGTRWFRVVQERACAQVSPTPQRGREAGESRGAAQGWEPGADGAGAVHAGLT